MIGKDSTAAYRHESAPDPPHMPMPRPTSRQVDAAGSASGMVGEARGSSSETSANLSLVLEREEAEELFRRRPLGDSRLFAWRWPRRPGLGRLCRRRSSSMSEDPSLRPLTFDLRSCAALLERERLRLRLQLGLRPRLRLRLRDIEVPLDLEEDMLLERRLRRSTDRLLEDEYRLRFGEGERRSEDTERDAAALRPPSFRRFARPR